jgi:hypothetical protein
MSRTEDRLPMDVLRFSDVVSGPLEGIALDSVLGVHRVDEELRGDV